MIKNLVARFLKPGGSIFIPGFYVAYLIKEMKIPCLLENSLADLSAAAASAAASAALGAR